jgi:hypothetical protein
MTSFFIVYPICIVSDKTNMNKILFSLGYRVWVRIFFVNLSDKCTDKSYFLSIILFYC